MILETLGGISEIALHKKNEVESLESFLKNISEVFIHEYKEDKLVEFLGDQCRNYLSLSVI